jgi:predicted CoA-binding protein
MNPAFQKSVDTFLSNKKVAVAGFSSLGNQPANIIYDKFKTNGYQVFAVNPKHESVQKVECYPSLKAIPEKVDAVMICTPPQATLDTVKECAGLGIKNVWLHQSFGEGSYNQEAVDYCKEQGINCVYSACPMMFIKPDFAHLCMRGILSLSGRFKKNQN